VRNAIAEYTTPAPGALVRDYNDTAVLGGFDYDSGGKLRLRVLAGYETRSFTSAALKSIREPVAEATAIYNLSGLTTLTGTLARQVADSADETTTGFTATSFKLSLDHEYLRNVLLQARAAVSINQYAEGVGNSVLYSTGLGATWLLNRNARLTATYDLVVRNADTQAASPSTGTFQGFGGNYVDNRYMLQLSLGF
jgi:hypothetical protein